jgi:hypothetical protein
MGASKKPWGCQGFLLCAINCNLSVYPILFVDSIIKFMNSKWVHLWKEVRLRLWLALLFFGTALLLLLAVMVPLPYAHQETGFPPIFFSSGETFPAGFENRLIILDWPLKLRVGDAADVELKLAVADQKPTLQPGQDTDVTELYQTYNLVAVARLEMAGVNNALAEMHEPFQPGQAVTFRWPVRPDGLGIHPGTVWLHLDLVPKAGGAVERSLLLARKVEIQSNPVMGLSGNAARILGGCALVLSAGLGYPFLWAAWKRARPKSIRKKV